MHEVLFNIVTMVSGLDRKVDDLRLALVKQWGSRRQAKHESECGSSSASDSDYYSETSYQDDDDNEEDYHDDAEDGVTGKHNRGAWLRGRRPSRGGTMREKPQMGHRQPPIKRQRVSSSSSAPPSAQR
jgi:hypothetical protein